MVHILPRGPSEVSPEEDDTKQSLQIPSGHSPFTTPDAERLLLYPFLLRFLTVSPIINGDQTIGETKTETGDGTGPPQEDVADDEDETDDPNNPGTAYVIADSNDKEDADY